MWCFKWPIKSFESWMFNINCYYGAWCNLLLVLYQLSLWSLISFVISLISIVIMEPDVISHDWTWCHLSSGILVYLVITEYGVICCYRPWYHLSLMWSLKWVISSIVIERLMSFVIIEPVVICRWMTDVIYHCSVWSWPYVICLFLSCYVILQYRPWCIHVLCVHM